MATLAALTDSVYNLLYGLAQQQRPYEDTIDGAFAQGAATLTVDIEASWKRGDYAEFDDGELIIFGADASGATAVRRAQRGTTDVAHDDEDVILKNPEFPRSSIDTLVEEVIDTDLWPKVWSWHNGTIPFQTADSTYDMPQYIEDIVMIYQYDLDNDERFYPLDRNWWNTERQISATVSTNKNLLRLRHVANEAAAVYYTGKRSPAFADVANLSTDIEKLIPWAVLGKLSQAGALRERMDPPRQSRDRDSGDAGRDFRGYMSEFLRLRKQLASVLKLDVREERIYRPRRRRVF